MGKLEKAEKAYKNLGFLNSKAARPLRIQAEYLEPHDRFRRLGIKSTIIFFGSARIKSMEEAQAVYSAAQQAYGKKVSRQTETRLKQAEKMLNLSRYYEDAVELSRQLTLWTMEHNEGKQRYMITTGGGPGIMEAANKGAMEAGGRSIGLNISLPMEQFPNPYITPELNFEFHYFFMRKYWFLYFAKAIVVFPGGFGTLDEMMEVLTLIQTKKVNKKMPIVLFGREFWDSVLNIDALVEWGTISARDVNLFKYVDTVDEAMEVLQAGLKA
ncbi:MAG TPA: TIGR00730 family Rossman fold protein [Caldithrix abyssi]|uniref:Cytokinin riboside 5'-monophosphate phosphoribohydrolase n=1 Tax=Caldithrix abyssi TaxID=187145 RepID=A0A7V5RNC3_CALAY|nr:TIGR00730 family Rossman fold protein [Caldithrix abyssi]